MIDVEQYLEYRLWAMAPGGVQALCALHDSEEAGLQFIAVGDNELLDLAFEAVKACSMAISADEEVAVDTEVEKPIRARATATIESTGLRVFALRYGDGEMVAAIAHRGCGARKSVWRALGRIANKIMVRST